MNRTEQIARCHSEIAAIRAEILAGNPDLQGLCLALADWNGELRILQGDEKKPPEINPGGRKELVGRISGFERVRALPVRALGRLHRESHLLAQCAADEPADAVGFKPARSSI
jgi:hypothetical protein